MQIRLLLVVLEMMFTIQATSNPSTCMKTTMMMMMMLMLVQVTWLSKLHEAQEKYQEALRSRYRDAGEAAAASGGTSHGDTYVVVGPSSEQMVDVTAAGGAGRSWLSAASATSSLIVPSFAVHDYGELVRDYRHKLHCTSTCRPFAVSCIASPSLFLHSFSPFLSHGQNSRITDQLVS